MALPRKLGLWSSIGLVIGITIGSGIFRSPAAVARQAPQPWLMLLLWTGGGALTLCGALSIAELAAALPVNGGYYTYIREAWGRRVAFLFGWAQLVLIRAAALGGVALVFGEYFLRALGVDPLAHGPLVRLAAALAIACASAANIVAVNAGAALVNASSTAKFAALGVLVTSALMFGGAYGGTFGHLASTPGTSITVGGAGLGLVSVLWAYDGFADVSLVAGEVTEPHRTLPRAIVAGTLAITSIYVLANLAYLFVLPAAAIGRSPLVAADAMSAIFGQTGATLVSLLVAISTFGSLNGQMLAAPRVYFTMAEDGLLWAPLASVHARFQTPYVAILLATGLGFLLVASQTFETLTNAFVLAVWPFYALSVAALYRFRRMNPERPRPYEVPGYPFVPAIFILAVVWFVANAFVTEPITTGITFGLIVAGVPVYEVILRLGSGTGSRRP